MPSGHAPCVGFFGATASEEGPDAGEAQGTSGGPMRSLMGTSILAAIFVIGHIRSKWKARAAARTRRPSTIPSSMLAAPFVN